ncbi:hypothetical protein Emag_000361 [Eimeria magna]
MQRGLTRNSQPSAGSGESIEVAKTNKIEGKELWGKQAAMSSSGDYLVHGRGRVLCTYDIFTGYSSSEDDDELSDEDLGVVNIVTRDYM